MRTNKKYQRYTRSEKKAIKEAYSIKDLNERKKETKRLGVEMGRSAEAIESMGWYLTHPAKPAVKEKAPGQVLVDISIAGVNLRVPKGASIAVSEGGERRKLEVKW